MNDRQFEQMIGINNEMPYAGLTAMLAASHLKYMENTTTEERNQRKLEIEAIRKEDSRRAWIHSGQCPTCESKLIRGKKDKKINYQRGWECKSCNEVHYV